ncbi:TetR family transcriptional regulator [Salimicrobium jeotgali]|uniref:TetR family transcriptional regulator n=2 Tax=Salimicrobium TaxID=351195 RepID=K2FMP2_9BACI|nr:MULTISPECIES: TetR/AcrR family transcriptional regulator [Salimicrobium]AKG04172.1 TetR family transcriptional regulator [Salimicrobium jeotgali]EKE32136.1 TetR family transcriptional regulator [Salimicrobium jeotgali]MBM7695747.1 TetR/AcrR family fatty acid metabolism transcriptional regulator [Salimicrobium jeotgali]PBB06743.1 TetR family transcriptional regulator [Salimicrobium humidisoli]
MKQTKPKYRQIIDAAVEVIAENGYHSSQVSKIAKRAGVADGTIYLYFKNKEDILVSLFQEKMGVFIERIESATTSRQTPSEKLRVLVETHFEQLSEDHHLAVVTQLELRQSNKMLRMKINSVLKKYLDVIDEIVEEGIREEVFRDNINRKLVRQLIFGTIDEVVTNWVMKEERYDITKQAKEVHEMIVEGLLRRP